MPAPLDIPPEIEVQMIRAIKAGEPLKTVAERFGYKQQTIHARLRHLIPRGKRRPVITAETYERARVRLEAGESAVDVAADLGIGFLALYRHYGDIIRAHRHRYKLTDADVEQARAAVESGESIRTVAKRFGVSYQGMQHALTRRKPEGK